MIASVLSVAGWAAGAVALIAAVLARRAFALRRHAVAEACHELRGPLAAVMLGLELGATESSLPAERIRAIELELGRAARALDDLEGIRRPRRRDRPSDAVDVVRLLEDSVEAWRPVAGAQGADLRLNWTGAGASVAGDRFRLAQATGNLIANAIEHGGGEVEVRGSTGEDRVRIEVLDDGPGLGMPVAQLIRATPARGRRGHGLRIAAAAAAAHGGRLAGAPTRRGARVVLELPLLQVRRPAQIRPR